MPEAHRANGAAFELAHKKKEWLTLIKYLIF
jgi:lipoprotein signal peptidase